MWRMTSVLRDDDQLVTQGDRFETLPSVEAAGHRERAAPLDVADLGRLQGPVHGDRVTVVGIVSLSDENQPMAGS